MSSLTRMSIEHLLCATYIAEKCVLLQPLAYDTGPVLPLRPHRPWEESPGESLHLSPAEPTPFTRPTLAECGLQKRTSHVSWHPLRGGWEDPRLAQGCRLPGFALLPPAGAEPFRKAALGCGEGNVFVF